MATSTVWTRPQAEKPALARTLVNGSAQASLLAKKVHPFWVSRGGRCLLCAQEHLRPAESEELGGAFQTNVVKEDLLKLINNMEDMEDDETYADATDTAVTHKRALYPPVHISLQEKQCQRSG